MNKLKYVLLTLFIFAATNSLANDVTEAEYWQVMDNIEEQLTKPYRSDNKSGLQKRRKKLVKYFKKIPPVYAEYLHNSLVDKTNELAPIFYSKLATATRNQMLNILNGLTNVQYGETASSAEEYSTQETGTTQYQRGFYALTQEVNNLPRGKRKSRYACWLNKLANPNVDDRIIEWRTICNRQSVGTMTGTEFNGSCEFGGAFISESEMYKNIKSVNDVNDFNDTAMMTNMKNNINFYAEQLLIDHEFSTRLKYVLKKPHDQMQRTIEVLGKWADNSSGFNTFPIYYQHIKDWIRKQQKNPDSLYSCK